MAAALAAVIVLASTASAAPRRRDGTTRDRAQIALGHSAQLTITASGDSNDPVSPPAVPGLEFVSVGQSSQLQSINGVTSSTTSVTYEVIPQRAGKFTIPALEPRVAAARVVCPTRQRQRSATTGNNSGASSLPPPATSGLSAGQTQPDAGRLGVRAAAVAEA